MILEKIRDQGEKKGKKLEGEYEVKRQRKQRGERSLLNKSKLFLYKFLHRIFLIRDGKQQTWR